MDEEVDATTYCPVCGNTMRIHIRGAKDIHYNIKGTYDVLRCCLCGFQQLRVSSIGEEGQKGVYEDSNYYAYVDPNNEKLFWRLSKYWIKKNRGYDKSIHLDTTIEKIAYLLFYPHFLYHLWWVPYQSNQKLSFLDIGCGGGKVVKLMKELGYDAWGTDVSNYGANVGQGEQLNIVVGDFNKIAFGGKRFDILYSRHALEHIEDPNTVFSMISQLLNNGGIGYISVPNCDSYMARLFGRYWYYLGVPLHVVNYTPKSIQMMLKKNGLEIVRVRNSADYMGVLGSTQAYLNRNSDKTSAEGYIINSKILIGLFQLLSYLGNLMNQGSHLQVQFRKL